MKKMIIAFAAIACAVVANAATVSWNITNVKDAEGTLLTSGHVYMFFAESAEAAATQIDAIKALAGTGASKLTEAMASANWNDTKKATAAGNFSMGTSAALGKYTLPKLDEVGLEGSTSYTAYAVIFDTDTITDESNYLVTTTFTAQTAGADTATNKGFSIGSQNGNTSWNAVNVPEPTSGLLLLLGMAGLALKRKRA